MSHPQHGDLLKIITDWQYFAPCLGTNITVLDSLHGYSNFASGYKSINPEEPLLKNDLFYIYSITKTFTAVVVLQLVEQGKISLDDPITNTLSGTTLPDSVTLKHLLNHTSGVLSYTDLPNYLEDNKSSPSHPWDFEYILENTCNTELQFQPGDQWQYSNTGFMLLLLMIEQVTGKTYKEIVDELIVRKLGLQNTYVADDVDTNVTNGYCRYLNDGGKQENITPIYNPWWCKTGLITSRSDEVTRLYDALFDGQLLSKESLNLMIEENLIGQEAPPHFKKPSYGLGLMIDSESKFGAAYGHGGDGPGFNTWASFYPSFQGIDRQIGITIFCNTSMAGHPFYLLNELLEELAKG